MGKIVSFSGTDNSGKTTQKKLLKKYCKTSGVSFKSTEFAFGYYLLRPILSQFKNHSIKFDHKDLVKRNSKSILKIWFLAAFVDIWIGYLFHLRPMKRKYDIVLCDRFYTDVWVNLLFYGYSPLWAYKVFVRLLPKADVSILFLVEAELGHSRINDEFPLSYYLEQVKIYKDLSQRIDGVVIDANRDKKTIFKEIKKVVI
ncbi:hypothetical protein ACFL2C_00045 [Patescibacteria group bacterium]